MRCSHCNGLMDTDRDGELRCMTCARRPTSFRTAHYVSQAELPKFQPQRPTLVISFTIYKRNSHYAIDKDSDTEPLLIEVTLEKVKKGWKITRWHIKDHPRSPEPKKYGRNLAAATGLVHNLLQKGIEPQQVMNWWTHFHLTDQHIDEIAQKIII